MGYSNDLPFWNSNDLTVLSQTVKSFHTFKFSWLIIINKGEIMMRKKQTNYLEEATNRFVEELRRKGIKVQTLEPKDIGKSTITFIPRIKIKERNNG